jgi:hypothetical protein
MDYGDIWHDLSDPEPPRLTPLTQAPVSVAGGSGRPWFQQAMCKHLYGETEQADENTRNSLPAKTFK